MNKPTAINQTTLRILYYRNKVFIIPIVIFAVCFVLILEVIFPQVKRWFYVRSQISEESKKILQLEKNIKSISSIDEETLDSQLQFLSNILPENKDYIGILNAISSAAIISGTKLGDYNFDVGDISEKDAKNNTIQLRLSLTGGVPEAKKFISALKNQAPLSEVANIEVSSKVINIVSIFYFKPFPEIPFNSSTEILGLSKSELNSYNELHRTIKTSSSFLENL